MLGNGVLSICAQVCSAHTLNLIRSLAPTENISPETKGAACGSRDIRILQDPRGET